MYTKISLDPERFGVKTDAKARHHKTLAHIGQMDQYENVHIPYSSPGGGEKLWKRKRDKQRSNLGRRSSLPMAAKPNIL
jgi:hypothetical protein